MFWVLLEGGAIEQFLVKLNNRRLSLRLKRKRGRQSDHKGHKAVVAASTSSEEEKEDKKLRSQQRRTQK